MPSTVKMQRWHNSCKKKCLKTTKSTNNKSCLLSFTDGHWRSLFWLGEELYTIYKLSQNTGTSGMYLIEVDAQHQVDSNPAPFPLQTSEMLAIFFLTFSLSIQSVSIWTVTQSSQVCSLFDTQWFFTFESQPQVKRLSFPCQLRLLTKSVWEVSLKLKNKDLKKIKTYLHKIIHWSANWKKRRSRNYIHL